MKKYTTNNDFELTFMERVILSESFIYESMLYFRMAISILNRSKFINDSGFKCLIRKKYKTLIKTEGREIIIILNDDNHKEKFKFVRKISIKHCSWGTEQKILSNKKCFFIFEKNFFSQIRFSGCWKSGLQGHLKKIISKFAYTKENHSWISKQGGGK